MSAEWVGYEEIPESDDAKTRENSPYWASSAANFARRRRIYLAALIRDGFTRSEAIAILCSIDTGKGL